MTRRPPVVYVDVEFTTLDPLARRPWEIAIIRDDHTQVTEHVYLISDVDLTNADPRSLDVGRFGHRHPRANPAACLANARYCVEAEAAPEIRRLTSGAQWVGIVPHEDANTIAAMLRRHRLTPAWHYQLIDAAIYAAGALGWFPPMETWEASEAIGIGPDAYRIHQALDDARWSRDLLTSSQAARRRTPAAVDRPEAGI